jgi:antitoxin (DNA-binding transcriptional repressor) of toxin-antitoxin stability system
MMQRVPVRSLPAEVQQLVDDAANGETVVIVLDDDREVQLVPGERKAFNRQVGWARGQIIIHDDFDDPVPGFEAYM